MGATKKILILGIGNLLFKDEGIGVHVVEKIINMALPANVEVVDGGIDSYAFEYFIENRDKVIVVDTMRAGGGPGSIYRLSGEEFLGRPREFKTTQEMEFEDALRIAILMKTNPKELVVIGVEPEDTGAEAHICEIGLSPSIENKIPKIIQMVMKEIETAGAEGLETLGDG